MQAQGKSSSARRMRQSRIIFAIGLIICTAIPAAATLTYLPLWRQSLGAGRIFGGTALMLGLAVILPLWRYISPKLRQPAPFVMWTLLFFAFYLIKDLIASLTVVAFWGMLSSGLATVLFALSAYLKKLSAKE